MSGPLDSAHRKIIRANKHFDDLEAEVKAFFEKDPYKQVVEPDPDNPQQLLHKFKLTESLDDTPIAEIVGDIVSNLRSALDHAVYAVARTRHAAPHDAYFPIASDSTSLERRIKGRCKCVPAEMYPLFRRLNPCQGGDEPLVALNAIRNADNHAILSPFGTSFVRDHISAKGTGFFSTPRIGHNVWDLAKNEVVFLKTRADTKLEYQSTFRFFIAFNEVKGVEGEPVMEQLDKIGREVNFVLDAIEGEARHLGFFQ